MTEDPGTSGLVCVRARVCVRVCVRAYFRKSIREAVQMPHEPGMDGLMHARMYERPCLSLALQAPRTHCLPAWHATLQRDVDVACDQSLSDW